MARDLLAYLDDTTPNPTNSQGRDLLSYLGEQEASTQPQEGSTGLSTNLYQYDPSKYDVGGIQPHELGNLEDIRARNQGSLDALARSTANLIGKTGVNVVGGIAGTIYGAGSAIANGEISKLWDNSLTTVLDSASEAIGDTFRVYKSADYEERSLLGRLFTHPIQFTDEFMDTLSFTTGAIVTELLTSGIASATIAPRALKYLKSLGRGAEAAEAAAQMGGRGILSKLGDAGTLTRQLATGAAWEASVESRHMAVDLKDKMYNEAMAEFGVDDLSQLPNDVVEDIEDRAANAGLFTFLTNMALVGGSNIVQFPKIFGAGYNTTKKAANNLGRVVRNEAGEYVDDAVTNLTRGQRISRNLLTAAKNPFMEGIVEEGGQNVLSNTAAMYWDRKNDDESRSNVDQFLNAFGTNLIDTYTSGEGWYEIGMGMLIGSLGAPGRGLMPGSRGVDPETGQRRELWTGGIAGAFQERAQEDAEVSNLVDRINENPDLMKAMKANYDFLTTSSSLQKSQDAALDANDIFSFQNYRDDQLHAFITSRIDSGLNSDLDTQVEQLRSLSPDDFYTSFRGEELAANATDRYKSEFKQKSISELQDRIDNTREAYDTVESTYLGNNEDLKQELIYNVANAKNIDIREQQLNRAVSDLTSGAISDLNLRVADERVSVNAYIKLLQDSLKSEEITDAEVEEINNTLENLNNIEDKKKTYSLDELNLINNFTATRPVEASLNTSKVLDLMEDSRKLRQRRQAFIDIYNKLFTKEGQEQFEKMQQDIAKAEEEAAETTRLKAETEQRNKQVKKERADVKKKAAKQKEEPVADDDMPVLTEATQDDEVTTPQIEPSADVSTEESIVEPPVEESVLEEPEIAPTEESSLLTPEEQATLTSIDADEIYEAKQVLKDDGLVKPVATVEKYSPDFKVFDDRYLRDVGNTITSLNIDYTPSLTGDVETQTNRFRLLDNLDEEGNLKINPNFDSRLQDPAQFTKDTPANIIFPTYEQIEERGIGGTGYTRDQYNQDVTNNERIPIAFVDDSGKIIGYLPTTDNVRDNVAREVRASEELKNQQLRDTIVNNPNTKYRFEITSKSTGTPMFSQNRGSIYNKLGDGNRLGEGVKIAVFKDKVLLQGQNSPVNVPIKLPAGVHFEDYYEEGVVYTVIPTADGLHSFAIPADVSNVSQEAADTILKMLDLFVGTSDAIKDERDRLAAETNFSDIKQLMDAISNIIYVNNDTDNHRFQVDLKNRKLKLGAAKDKIFNLSDLNKSETRDKIANEIKKKYYAVKTANMNKPYTQFKVNEGKLDVIPHNDYNDYLNAESIITTNLQSEPIEGTDKRYYTVQSVITISEPIVVQEETEVPSATEVVEPTKTTKQKFNNPLGAKSRKKKNRPDTFEDFDGIVTPNSSIDQQAEELMRKCRK